VGAGRRWRGTGGGKGGEGRRARCAGGRWREPAASSCGAGAPARRLAGAPAPAAPAGAAAPAAGWRPRAPRRRGQRLPRPGPARGAAGRARGGWLPMAGWTVFADDWRPHPRVLAVHGERHPAAEAWRPRLPRRGRLGGRQPGRRNRWRAARRLRGPGVALPRQVRLALVGLDDRPAPARPRFAGAGRRWLARAVDPVVCALESALRLERAEALSVTDDLTQLYNARFLAQRCGGNASAPRAPGVRCRCCSSTSMGSRT